MGFADAIGGILGGAGAGAAFGPWGAAIGGGLGLLGGLVGDESTPAGYQTVNRTAPRTAEGQALMDQFMKVYGSGGPLDSMQQAQDYRNLQQQVYNAPDMSLKVGGATIPIMSPALRQKVGLVNQTMPVAYAPFIEAMQNLERNRYSGMSGGYMPRQAGTVEGLMPGLSLMAGMGKNIMNQDARTVTNGSGLGTYASSPGSNGMQHWSNGGLWR